MATRGTAKLLPERQHPPTPLFLFMSYCVASLNIVIMQNALHGYICKNTLSPSPSPTDAWNTYLSVRELHKYIIPGLSSLWSSSEQVPEGHDCTILHHKPQNVLPEVKLHRKEFVYF